MSVPTPIRLALLTSAFGALLAVPAAAQHDGRYHPAAYGPDTEEVIVTAPYDRLHRSPNGTVSLSREVSYADLDLSTRTGARELRLRVRDTARDVCDELWERTDDRLSLGSSDKPRCERDAYRSAMAQAHDAIRDARGPDYDE